MNYSILYSNVFVNKTDDTKKYVSVLVKDDNNFYIIGIVITSQNGKTTWDFDNDTDRIKLGIIEEKDIELFLDKLQNDSKSLTYNYDDYKICDLILNGTEMKVAICDKDMLFHIVNINISNGNVQVDSSYDFKTKEDLLNLWDRVSEFVSKSN